MRAKVTISSLESFDNGFGSLGLKIGSRTGTDRRTQDDEEWYVIRRFLKYAVAECLFAVPFSIEKELPPAPDFKLKRVCAVVDYIEHTEATLESDQREFTTSERDQDIASILGKHGGRYLDGAVGDRAERDWAADVLSAIRRIRGKAILQWRNLGRHLVIYPNSNASLLLDEQDAFRILHEATRRANASLARIIGGCTVHVFGKGCVCFDLFGSYKFVKRQDNFEHA